MIGSLEESAARPVRVVRVVRVAHVISHPIQYFVPLYRELAARGEVDLTVYFCSTESASTFFDAGFQREISWGGDLLSGYSSVSAVSARRRRVGRRRWTSLHLDILWHLLRRRYDVIWVHGYGSLVNWLIVLLAAATGTPVLLRDEQILTRPRPLWRRGLKAIPLRVLMRACSGLAIGQANRRYLERYGMAPERIFFAPYAVDARDQVRQVDRLRGSASEVREQFGLDGRPVVLFVGKLIWQKQPSLVIEAFAAARERCDAQLLIVGDGPLGREMKARVDKMGLDGIRFAGFLPPGEIGRAYAVADVLVLPSVSETWGLVVNEAMSVGIPAIVSDRVGCCDDLVRPGPAGIVVPHDDAAALADAIVRVVNDAALRGVLSKRSLERIASYSIAACADGIVSACQAAAKRPSTFTSGR